MSVLERFPRVFEIDLKDRKIIATLNLTPGATFYGEQLINIGDGEYRVWNPYRSKLAAAILKGLKNFTINYGCKVLYLGVASGTTCSHISDIVGEEGHIWGVDFAPRPLRELIENLSKIRVNVSPVFGDARHPERYSHLVPKVDVLYADLAQPDQANLVVKNAKIYLAKRGWVLVAIKSRSVDATRKPEEIYSEQAEILKKHGFSILELINLEPYEKDHAMIIARFDA
ncbi:fibrillarin-like rRNA/tRNA 2'-O-methyltransferase [Candidatus Bathyarchaeota archaeon]|nr:fibrillarin-like rRNA/tRNA 2'-O-methyltransferase [Candidatus Bathyarchaeota archaeon]MBS7629997.1 fibrillarin-like rRNA/tRNA 2'-O-methyltransferase [Candidatus Bathyarchaeota archaeon]